MNKTFTKRILSLALAVVMAVSTMAISVVSTSAASKIKYTIAVNTGGSSATSIDIMKVTVIGTKGKTSTHSISSMATKNGTKTVSFNDAVDVGTITGIEIKNVGIDDWYPNYFTITSPSSSETLYGGRWIGDNKTVTFKNTDNVFELKIKTGDVSGAGTDDKVQIKLVDTNGVTATLLNANEIHPETDAFESKDDVTLYISAPNKFGMLKKIDIDLTPAGILTPDGDWFIEKIQVKYVSGTNKGHSSTFLENTWIKE